MGGNADKKVAQRVAPTIRQHRLDRRRAVGQTDVGAHGRRQRVEQRLRRMSAERRAIAGAEGASDLHDRSLLRSRITENRAAPIQRIKVLFAHRPRQFGAGAETGERGERGAAR